MVCLYDKRRRKRGGLLREPTSVDGNPPLRVRAVPSAGAADGLPSGMASEFQHPRLRRALQSEFAGRRRIF